MCVRVSMSWRRKAKLVQDQSDAIDFIEKNSTAIRVSVSRKVTNCARGMVSIDKVRGDWHLDFSFS